ncbi:MAG: dockerin type I repeat-containing protein, partial [Phycisphaerae bacterium]
WLNFETMYAGTPRGYVLDTPTPVTEVYVPVGSTSSLSGSLTLWNVGTSELGWTAAADAAWLTLGTASGGLIDGGNIQNALTINPTGLAAGTYLGTITLTSGAQVVKAMVRLHVGATASSAAVQAVWALNGAGSWSTGSNWVGNAAPSVSGDTALLGNAVTSIQTVTMNTDNTVSTLNLNNTSAGYTILGSGTLTLQASSGTAALNVTNGNYVITPAKVEIASDTLLAVASGSGLTIGGLTNGLVVDTGKTLYIAKNSIVHVAGTLHIFGNVTLNGTAGDAPAQASVFIVDGLDGTGSLDLTNNKLMIRSSTLSNVEAQLASGGLITSSLAAVGANHTALGVLPGSQYLALHGPSATFGGQTVLPGDVLVGYTWAGDTTLKGSIDATDFTQIDAAWLKGTYANSGAHWINGDFNHDGKITVADFALIDAAFTNQNGPLAARIVTGDLARFASTSFATLYQTALASTTQIGTSNDPPAPAAGSPLLMTRGSGENPHGVKPVIETTPAKHIQLEWNRNASPTGFDFLSTPSDHDSVLDQHGRKGLRIRMAPRPALTIFAGGTTPGKFGGEPS